MQQKLLQHLSHELWQTEVSASQHCRREAERLGDTPPARALLSAAEHADDVLVELPKLSVERPIAHSGAGMAVGKLFSGLRDTVADKLLTSERSYRGTLLGLRHGLNLIQLMRATAQQTGDVELQAFFDRWLTRRLPIVEDIEAQLRWFAQHPESALERARGLFGRKSLKSILQGRARIF